MPKTTKEMLNEIYTVLLGVPGTEEKGMAGKLSNIDDQLTSLNGSVKTNTTWRKAICWVMGIIATALTTTIVFMVTHYSSYIP